MKNKISVESENLIREFEIAVTGANIHAVNEAKTNYRACIDSVGGNAWWVKKDIEKREKYRKLAEK